MVHFHCVRCFTLLFTQINEKVIKDGEKGLRLSVQGNSAVMIIQCETCVWDVCLCSGGGRL
jgi:hypothetical protein